MDEALRKDVEKFLGNRLLDALFLELKKERMDRVNLLKEELRHFLEEKYKEEAKMYLSVLIFLKKK